jgi:hypothetical protein
METGPDETGFKLTQFKDSDGIREEETWLSQLHTSDATEQLQWPGLMRWQGYTGIGHLQCQTGPGSMSLPRCLQSS